ncbi:MAG: DUF2877 domain-containing protein [Nitrospinota bacterium]
MALGRPLFCAPGSAAEKYVVAQIFQPQCGLVGPAIGLAAYAGGGDLADEDGMVSFLDGLFEAAFEPGGTTQKEGGPMAAAEGVSIQRVSGGGGSPASFPGELRFPLTLMGGAARRALGLAAGAVGVDGTDGAAAGRVLAVFQRSFYLEMAGGLVCIGPAAIGAGPMNAECALPGDWDWEASGLRPGDRAWLRGGSIRAGGFSFLAGGARIWRPEGLPKGWWRADLMDALSGLAVKADWRGPVEGLARLLSPPGANISKRFGGDAPKDPFLRAGSRAAHALTGWLRHEAAHGDAICGEAARNGAVQGDSADSASPAGGAPPGEAADLIGLGPGLTPSGDDFIGGAMIALRMVGMDRLANRLAGWALPLAETRTSRISRAHLACAAAGEGAGALHDTIRAMALPGPHLDRRDRLTACLDAVDAIGHTSGWDALAGAAAAIRAAFDRPGRMPG